MPKTRIKAVNNNIGGIINAKDDTGIPESYLAYAKNVIGRPLGSMSARPKTVADSSFTPATYRILYGTEFVTPDGINRTGLIEI